MRTSMGCIPTMMRAGPMTIRAVAPSSARQRASFTGGPIEVMTGAEGASRAASAPVGSRGQGMALPGAPRVRCDLPSVAMVFHTIGRDPLPARAESKSGRGESKDHPEGCSSNTEASMHRSFGEQYDVFGDHDGPLVGAGQQLPGTFEA
ncbi:MAG: hypothetical protein ACR2M4_02600, partial [Actinomycetota bacterium]